MLKNTLLLLFYKEHDHDGFQLVLSPESRGFACLEIIKSFDPFCHPLIIE
ncbi:hypothetical protein LguiA_019911 [Lonicera macranthoides]